MATKSDTKSPAAAPRQRPRTPARRTAGPGDGQTEAVEAMRAVSKASGELAREVAAGIPSLAAAPSTNFTSELNNIDFRKMIGGPLQAAVDAQVASALATVDFINKVGFKPVDPDNPDAGRELVMADFTHQRKDVDKDGNEVTSNVNLRVPLLAMLPIPSLRIEQVLIDFNVKLNSVESSSTSDQLGVSADVSGGWGPVKFKVSASYQRKTATNVEVKKEYSLNVNVKAVQDEMPAGLEKVLNMLAA